jgi:hypothetical protein
MDYSNLPSSRLVHPYASGDDDQNELLAGTRVPMVNIRPPSEHMSGRGRHSRGLSNDMDTIDENATSRYGQDVEAVGTTAPRLHNTNPTNTSFIRRLSTIRSPISPIFRNRSARNPLGKYNEISDDYDVDSVPVDISSLAGMGFEMIENPQPAVHDFSDQNTEYISPASTSTKPGFASFVKKTPAIGDGLVVGEKLMFDPSKATLDRAKSSSRYLGDDDIVQRSKTVRQVGQTRAEQRKAIVAVEEKLKRGEGIDLSSFEGSTHNHRVSTQSLEASSSRSPGSPQITALSYFFPADTKIPNWRPFSMSTWYISLLIAVSLGLAVFQEWLCQYSLRLAKKDPPHAILEFNKVSEVSVLNFFAWKCKPRSLLSLAPANVFRLTDHGHNLLRRPGFHYGLRYPTSRAIPPAVATSRKSRFA